MSHLVSTAHRHSDGLSQLTRNVLSDGGQKAPVVSPTQLGFLPWAVRVLFSFLGSSYSRCLRENYSPVEHASVADY